MRTMGVQDVFMVEESAPHGQRGIENERSDAKHAADSQSRTVCTVPNADKPQPNKFFCPRRTRRALRFFGFSFVSFVLFVEEFSCPMYKDLIGEVLFSINRARSGVTPDLLPFSFV